MQIIRVFFPPRSPDYETDRVHCVSCARCFGTCPYELVRRGIPVTIPPEGGGNA
jgi:ferredoxin